MTSIYVKYSRQKCAPVHVMKVYKGVEVHWLIYAPPERNVGTHLTGDGVGSRASLDVLGEEENLMILQGIESQSL